jgi:uncharacterized membrane protein YfcA
MLAGIGLAAGLFSALFGVGGGILVVPLLIMLFGFSPKRATATSLAAIGLTAGFGVVAYGILGEVDWIAAVEVGLPAVAGTFAGSFIQHRLSSRALTVLFAGFMVVIATFLLVE